jgi:multidrug resistance protein
MGKMSQSMESNGELDSGDGEGHGERSRRMITAALTVAMIVTAMEQLVVSPAMPTIIAHLGGFSIYPWVISAYLLAATVSTPIYGKLADLFGRKRVLIFGLVLFSVGSILSGTSMSMGQLIAMRTIQGLGAGAVGPVVLTLVGDLFSLEERAHVQSWFSAVWGLSSVAGPLIGGYLADHVGWRWVFLVSVPFAIVAILMLMVYVKESLNERTVAPIDWLGAGLLTAGMSVLLWIVLDGANHGAVFNLTFVAASAGLLGLFVAHERRAADPILPMDLMVRPTIFASLLGSLLIGGILFGLDTYVPLFIQGARGGDATQAGRALMPLFLAWAVSVALAARAVVHFGFRRGGLIGSGLITLGNLILVLGAAFPEHSRPFLIIGLGVVGMGMGPTSLSFILAVQHSVSWGQRGVATGAVIFLRTIGGAIGVGILGAALAWELGTRLAEVGATGINIASALRPETHEKLLPSQLAAVRVNLGLTLRDVFLQVAALGVGSLICALWLPNKHATLEHSSQHERAIRREEIELATAAVENGAGGLS